MAITSHAKWWRHPPRLWPPSLGASGPNTCRPTARSTGAACASGSLPSPPPWRELEAITHPLIRQRILAWREAQTAPYCILSVAILVESGMNLLVDRILVVDVPQATQLERLVTRDGIAEPLAQQMIAAQASRTERLARADDVVDNTRPRQALVSQVARLHQLYIQSARTPA